MSLKVPEYITPGVYRSRSLHGPKVWPEHRNVAVLGCGTKCMLAKNGGGHVFTLQQFFSVNHLGGLVMTLEEYRRELESLNQLVTFTLVDLEVLDTFSEVNLFRDDGDQQLPPVYTTELMVKPIPELADRKDTPLIGNVLCDLTDIDTGSQFSIFPRTVLISEGDGPDRAEDRLCIRLEHCGSGNLVGGTLIIHSDGLVELHPTFQQLQFK